MSNEQECSTVTAPMEPSDLQADWKARHTFRWQFANAMSEFFCVRFTVVECKNGMSAVEILDLVFKGPPPICRND